ncbi:MAG: hypothetical protein KAY37_06125 [Phycisphaerae bacterium]|nr:hypothetical protein [Phycisphaerae bacterium]
MNLHRVVVRSRRTWLIVVGLALVIPPAVGETLTYVLSPEPELGRLQVELTWETKGRASSSLCVSPHWGGVEDVPALLKNIVIKGASAGRQEKACWIVSHAAGATLHCQYTVEPGRRAFTWASPHHPITTETFFHGIGNTFLLVPKPGDGGAPEEYEVLLRWKVPKGWQAACSWGYGRHLGARLNVNDLRHSVYLAGPLVTQNAEVAGAGELTVVLLDRFGFSLAEFTKTAAEIIAAECYFMHEKEFPPFIVTVVPVGEQATDGELRMVGTGLYQSLALLLPPQAPLTEGVEHLLAHELFHHWNGKLLRAADPEELVYWFTEGFTDYYALRILFESGRWTPATYAKWINRHLRQYEANPARNASNEAIRVGYWRQRNTLGEVPYQRGLLLGLRWHRLARGRGEPAGLDRLFHDLVRRGRAGDLRVTNEVIRSAGNRLLGDWFGVEFDRYVVDAETVEVPADALAPELVGVVEEIYQYELGFDRERSRKAKSIHGLVPGSAADEAGLREGDKLKAWRLHDDVDRKVQIKVHRDGKTETISYYPRGRRSEVLQFRPAATR